MAYGYGTPAGEVGDMLPVHPRLPHLIVLRGAGESQCQRSLPSPRHNGVWWPVPSQARSRPACLVSTGWSSSLGTPDWQPDTPGGGGRRFGKAAGGQEPVAAAERYTQVGGGSRSPASSMVSPWRAPISAARRSHPGLTVSGVPQTTMRASS